jgi:beta-N-acetylhexosaminidase
MKNEHNSRPLVISLKSTRIDAKEKELLTHDKVGGVILFTRNFESKFQITQLVSQIKSLNSKATVMVDHEGGKIWRFKDMSFPNPGSMEQLGILYDIDPQEALSKAYDFGYKIAINLFECGIDLNLAPVLDLGIKNENDEYVSSIIGRLGRAIHDDPAIVAMIAAKFIEGQKAAGIQSIGKHFPGHGSIPSDTHLKLSVDLRNKEDIFALDMEPFRLLSIGKDSLGIRSNTLSAIMPAHIIYPAIDDKPAGFSKIWLQKILRENISFKGTIISDCLSMQAVQDFIKRNNHLDIVSSMEQYNITHKQAMNLVLTKQALVAGCDLVIFNRLHDENLENLLNSIN